MTIQLSTSAIILTPTYPIVVGKCLKARLNHETFSNVEVNQKKYLKKPKSRTKLLPIAGSASTTGNKLKLLLKLTYKENYV